MDREISKKTPKTNASKVGDVFCYTLKKTPTFLTLQQEETRFSLEMKIEKLDKTLRVTRFKLANNAAVQDFSQDLHDMADIEIVLKALIHLFTYAKQHEMREISFMLPQSEAIQIYCFDELFEDLSSFTPQGDKLVALTLSCAFQYYFLERIAEVKKQLTQELWMRQREDIEIRNYLQNVSEKKFIVGPKVVLPIHQATIIEFPALRG